jgi:hypothetical protein
MIQEEEQNQKDSIILPKPYRTSNYKWWNSKKYRKKEQKFKIQNPEQAKQ